ncbi:MAG: amidohydrolase family protein [Candidatus Latescibacter sp.]|nr:amidohydrolase family protein [Candidatus Latescibacter sp.]
MYDLVINGTAIYEKKDKLVAEDVSIGISQGVIEKISTDELEGKKIIHIADNELLMPAFYGTHSHGGGNLTAPALGKYDAALGRFLFDEAEIAANIGEMLLAHLNDGTTAINITAMACPMFQLESFLKASAGFINKPGRAAYMFADFESIYFGPDNPKGEIHGAPIMYNPNLGAQSSEYMVRPSRERYKRLEEIAKGRIGRVCVGMDWDADDSSKPARNLIEYLVDQGTVVGFGHTNATKSVIKEGIISGGKYVWVHATNGHTTATGKKRMLTILPCIGELVDSAEERDASFYAEIITDNRHVDPRAALWVRSIFGPDKMILVDDNIGHTHTKLPEGVDRVVFGGTEAVLSEDGKVFVVNDGTGNTYCGSNATMWRCAVNYANMLMRIEENGKAPIPAYRGPKERHDPLDIEKALIEVSMAASMNPAKLYGLNDRGSIAPGKVADLLVVEKIKEDYPIQLRLKRIIQDGKEITIDQTGYED